MKITYIVNARIPTEKAHGIQVMHTCEALARQGAAVELVVPWRFNALKEDPFAYYGVEPIFQIRRVPCLDLTHLGKIGFALEERTFALFTRVSLMLSSDPGVIYVRGEPIIWAFASLAKKHPVFLETHVLQERKMAIYKPLFRKLSGIVVVTRHYRAKLAEQGISRVLYAPDAVDIKKFDITESRESCRTKLGLPAEKRIVGYVGKYRALGVSKGVESLIDAFAALHTRAPETFLLIVGMSTDETREVTARLTAAGVDPSACRVVPHVPNTEVARYLRASDALIMNYPADGYHVYYLSPLKLFEYMASGTPIVASDLPSIRDILDEANATLVAPDNQEALVAGMSQALSGDVRVSDRARQACEDVKRYSWDERARQILTFTREAQTMP